MQFARGEFLMSCNLRDSGALSCNFMVGMFLGVRFGGSGCAMVRMALWWLSVVRFAGWGSAFLQFS